MKKNVFLISIFIVILLSSCIFFQNINQPTKSLPNDIVTISLHTTTQGTDPNGIYSPYFGVCLPIGWTIPGDSIKCKGVYNNAIYYDDSLSIAQNGASPAPAGYFWWVGKGVGISTVSGNVYAVLSVQTDNQIGLFSIDYMLGESYHGVNQQRSDDHQIEIVDNEYSPRRLQAAAQGGSVKINWSSPNNTTGLLGYNIYRDEEKINSGIVTDTIFYDSNPIEGIHYYTIASYYSNGNEYMMPYDKSVVYQSIYVSPNGNNANNGSSFNDALKTINYAVSVIKADSSHPITVFLAPGFYSSFTNEEQFPVTCLSYISLTGSGTEATILDADGQSAVFQFIEARNLSTTGLTIRNGDDGIYINESDLSLTNVAIKENSSGVNCISSVLELVNVDITNNNAGDRGGGINTSGSDLYLVNVNITNNTAGNYGGAVSISNSIFEMVYGNILYNSANSGGGISCSDSSTLNLINLNISNNTADNIGGGIYCIDSSKIDLANVKIVSNTATESGGGIYCQDNSVLNFDQANRSNIYLNQAFIGNDLYSHSLQNIVVDTFTVFSPNDIHAYPINNFTFDIWNCVIYQTGEELFVSPQGDNNNSGLTAADPLKTIQFALMKIMADSSHHNRINLLDGIYSQSSNEEFFPIIIPSYVNLKGTSDNSVILDAEGNSRAILIYESVETTISDLTVCKSSDAGIYCESSNARFERLRIVNNEGSGFYCNNSSPELLNNTIAENEGVGLNIRNSSNPVVEYGMVLNNIGVGISCDEYSNPTIDSIIVSGNDGNGIECNNNCNPELIDVIIISNEGRGISCWNDSSPMLRDVIINNNNGGIYCDGSSNPTLENCTIENNSAEYGGAIYCNNSSPSLNRVTITNNSSENDGGAIYCSGYSSPTLDSVILVNNTADNGGAIYCENSSPSLNRVTITNNSSQINGGGIDLNSNSSPDLINVILKDNSAIRGGGIRCNGNSNPKLVNVLIADNIAEYGAGIQSVFSNPILQNVTIANNIASHLGGGLFCHRSTPLLLNVTMTNNTAEDFSGGMFCTMYSSPVLKNCILWENTPYEIYLGNYTTLTIAYSDLKGGESGIVKNNIGTTIYWMQGNIDEDPLLNETGDLPFRLLSGSPGIDAGNPDTVFNDPDDPNNPGFALWPAMGTIRNDMGAYGGPNAAYWNIIVTEVEEEEIEELQTPTEFELSQNYPNPFNPSTTIQYSIKERSSVELILYDILGAQVVVLVNEEQDAGYYKVNFNAGRLASGVYLYRLQAGSFVETKKMMLMK